MIVPDFWAEARMQRPRARGVHAITVRRFGWSEKSQAEAEAMAQQRVQQALEQIVAGDSVLRRRERKLPYNGAEGVPIREEVLSRDGDVVITRNSYGAECLNTPDVLFADIDYETEPRTRFVVAWIVFLLLAGGLATAWFRSGAVLAGSAFAVMILGYPLAAGFWKLSVWVRGGPVRLAAARIAAFMRTHADWHLRLYHTPAGLRVLVMHRTFRPDEPAVEKFFAALGVDPLYRRMCRNQQCFRARISPKPWRIGLTEHLRPRPGVWPVKPERMPLRNDWIRRYESQAGAFAACAFVEALGPSQTHPRAHQVMKLHDLKSQALTRKPIA